MKDEEFEVWNRLLSTSIELRNTTELLELLIEADLLPNQIKAFTQNQIEKNKKCHSMKSPTELIDRQMNELKDCLDDWDKNE